MKKMMIKTLGFMAFLSLANCRTNDGNFNILVSNSSVSQIEYSDGGWMPGPGGDNFRLHLSLQLKSDSTVLVTAEEPECKASLTVTRHDFDELVELLTDVKTDIGQYSMMDVGNEKISLQDKDGVTSYYLREGDSSYKKPILQTSDAKLVRNKINEIAQQVFTNATCGEFKFSVSRVIIQENAKVQIPVNAPISSVRVTDMSVDVKNKTQVLLNGYNKTIKSKTECVTKIDDLLIDDKNLVDSIQKINIQHTGLTCEMAFYFDPKLGTDYSLRSFKVFDKAGNFKVGYLTCLYEDRAQNTEDFEERLKEILSQQAKICKNR